MNNEPDFALLQQRCAATLPDPEGKALLTALADLFPGRELKPVLVRGGWHRLGGVIDGDYRPVAEHLLQWAEEESDGDVEELIAKYVDSGYFATRIAGKTHYLAASTGPEPTDFIQIEVEELQEEVERILIDRDWYPEDLEEFIDPMDDYPRMEPEAVGSPRYVFRRAFAAGEMIALAAGNKPVEESRLHRFVDEWKRSSAAGHSFCEHWVFGVRETLDADGDTRYTARAVSTFTGELQLPMDGVDLYGADLANLMSSVDRAVGYPFAWYFLMLAGGAVPHRFGEQTLNDQLTDYDYLPKRDLELLKGWRERPYAI